MADQIERDPGVLAQDRALAQRAWLVERAGFQLAILIAQDEQAPTASLEERLGDINTQEKKAGFAADHAIVLTEAEREILPEAKFVVDSLFKAMTIFIPKRHYARRRVRSSF